MASIIKRKKSYSVVYNYTDENGEIRQKWETWHTRKEALKRKAEVENKQNEGVFISPNEQTVKDFLYDFVCTYGERKWGVSMYDSQTALIANYINPVIGDMAIQNITSRLVDKFIQALQKTPCVVTKTHKAKNKYVSNYTIEKIIKLLSCAFKQAVRWELIGKNPFEGAVIPKAEHQKRDIWDADTIRLALDKCTDSKLYIAMNLAFACSLRMGEILGLTWKNVHIEDSDIYSDNAYIFIDAELTRVSKRAMEALGEKDIYHIFKPLMPNTTTRLVLKKPKTESSIRKIWLPKTVAYILRDWRQAQNELKGFLGDEYQDFDLVISLPNGRPCEGRLIEKEFGLLKEAAKLPNVVFHSLRHSSTTYKLKLNHGDLKATQGDTGHAEIDMITKVYAHILDEDRKINAQKFETAFYSNPDLRQSKPPQQQSETPSVDINLLIEQLKHSPELANMLASVLSGERATASLN
ncbi:MAG: tyrosine-type recombinase/integrase [Ruminococcus sp.]